MPIIEGVKRGYENAGVPVAGTNEVQTLTLSAVPASGTFRVVFDGHRTGLLAHNISAANMQTALNALPSIGAGGVSVGLVGQVYTVTFSGGNVQRLAVPQMTIEDNTVKDAGNADVTITPATTTPGVTATARGAAPGAVLLDTTNNKLYINGGTALAPAWKLVTSAA